MANAQPSYVFQKAIDAALVGYWCLLVLATHLPPSAIERLPSGVNPRLLPDISKHFVAFAILGILLALVILSRKATSRGHLQRCWLALGLGVPLYGLIDEATQPLTGRYFDWSDFRANAAGSLSVLLMVTLWVVAKERRSRNRSAAEKCGY